MKTLTPIALSVSLLFAVQAVQAGSGLFSGNGADDGLSAGLDMMLRNSSLLRNGDNVWERAREGFQLQEVNAELIRRDERLYASKPEYFKRILERSHKYLFHIMNEVERRGMPTEIALLPMVESAFNPAALSHVGASGLWQFMPTTGRQYGLEQTWWYDGRRDVLEATRAALDYLQNLYGMFGDWTLALAAYNWGEGNLTRSIARTRARGETENYENVVMPAETRNYVPKLIAIRNILADPAKYGLKLDRFPNKPYFLAVNTGKHIDFDLAAKLAETSLREFKELNPAYNLPVAAYKNGRQLLVPAEKLSRFERNLAKWDKPLLTWQVVTPATGETVQSVASRYDMSSSELVSANHLNTYSVQPGRPLLVALRKGSAPANQAAPIGDTDTSAPLLASATPVETVLPVAAAPAQNVPAKPTLLASAAPAQSIRVSETVKVAAPAKPATMAEPAVATPAQTASVAIPATMVAKQADAVAVQVASTAAVAAQAATEAPATTLARNEPAAAATAENITRVALAQPTAKPAAPRVPGVLNASQGSYTVGSGDTLYNISRRLNLTVAELKALNELPADTVKIGQVLKIKGAPATAQAPAAATAVATATPSAQDDAVVQVAALNAAVQPTSRAVPVEYVVQKGDTLFSIARKFGVRHSDIQNANGQQRQRSLTPGQRVWIEGL